MDHQKSGIMKDCEQRNKGTMK